VVASWRPDLAVQLAFNADPNDPSAVPTWVDLSHLFMRMASCKRGRQYELDQNQANAPTLEFYDPSELLNPANTASPYYGYLVPYRQILIQGMWPNTTTGNILNTAGSILYDGDPYNGSFESYAPGALPGWLTGVGGTIPAVVASTPYQGANCAVWTVGGGATVQGAEFSLPCIPGRQYTVSAYVQQTSASTQQITVDGSAGTSTTTINAYVRLSKTFTATQPSHTCRVATTGTAVAGIVRLDAVQHEQSASATAFTTTGPIIYPVFRGFIERFPRTWRHRGVMGLCAAKAVDAFGPLNRFKVDTEVRGSINALEPDYYWPLGEPDGTTTWGGNGTQYLTAISSPYGGGPLDSGVAHGIPGDPGGTGVEITLPAYIGNPQGTLLYGGGPNSPIVTGGSGASWALSVAIWYARTDVDDSKYQIVMLSAPGLNNVPLSLAMSDAGGGAVDFELATWVGIPSGIATVGSFDYDEEPHLLVANVSVAADTLTQELWVDGTYYGSNTETCSTLFGTATPDLVANTVTVGGFVADLGYCTVNAGLYSHVAIWDRVLTSTEVTALYVAGRGSGNETAGDRIYRYLSYGWSGEVYVNPGRSTMGVNALARRTALLAACQDVTVTENGNFWADSAGVVRFAGRDERYQALTAVCTFGEDVAGGEYPYGEGIVYDIDPMRIYNEVTVTNSGGIVSRRTDPTSIKRFFPNSFERTINVADDNEAIACAQWILTGHKDPQQRVASLTLDPASNPTLWTVVLGLEVGDRVTVKTRPKAANSGAGFTMSGDYFVESISHDTVDMDAGVWRTTLTMSPVPVLRPFILDDATYGVLDDTSCTTVY
jgi:hypothetical protein